jgi:hypothetical protein
MLLARRGAKVLLLDRATFPTDIPHGHFVHRHARAGMIDPAQFFNPQNLERLLGGLSMPAVWTQDQPT